MVFHILPFAALLTAVSAGCELARSSAPKLGVDYSFTTAAIARDSTDEFGGYFVTMVRRKNEAPWLIVAEPLDLLNAGFTTESSSNTDAVTIDGTEYTPIRGRTIVVFQASDRMHRFDILTDQNGTIQSLRDGFGDTTAAQLRLLIERRGDGAI